MTAIREFVKVVDHKVSVTLPIGFDYDEVEVLVLPKENYPSQKSDMTMFSNHSASTITEWQNESEDSLWK